MIVLACSFVKLNRVFQCCCSRTKAGNENGIVKHKWDLKTVLEWRRTVVEWLEQLVYGAEGP